MKLLNLERLPDGIDPINYAAIEILEKLGNKVPNEKDIHAIEDFINEIKQFIISKFEKIN